MSRKQNHISIFPSPPALLSVSIKLCIQICQISIPSNPPTVFLFLVIADFYFAYKGIHTVLEIAVLYRILLDLWYIWWPLTLGHNFIKNKKYISCSIHIITGMNIYWNIYDSYYEDIFNRINEGHLEIYVETQFWKKG